MYRKINKNSKKYIFLWLSVIDINLNLLYNTMEIIYFRRKGMNKKWEFYNSDIEKVREISEKFEISELLAAVLINRNIVEDEDGYCVLSIDFKHQNVSYRTFPPEEEETATNLFSSLEQSIDSYEAVLLVSIAKMREIRDAYPSYFLDTREFLQSLKEFNDSCSVYK